MKELSIEEKAKRYDEAIEKGKQIQNTPYTAHWDIMKEVTKYLLPELKESKDERIRKWIIGVLSTYEQDRDLRNAAITWLEKQGNLVKYYEDKLDKCACDNFNKGYKKALEKQGERKSLDDIAKEVIKDKDAAISFLKSTGIMNENGELADEYKIEQGEQKPTEWSEEDNQYLCGLIGLIEQSKAEIPITLKGKVADNCIDWLKSLKDRVQPQPKQEWSEKDKKHLNRAINILDASKTYTTSPDKYEDTINWLKSLRPQNWTKEDKERYISCLQRLSTDNPEQPETINSKWFKEHVYPQSTYKPSEEQMKALEHAINCYSGISPTNTEEVYTLEIMKEQLKKLKE